MPVRLGNLTFDCDDALVVARFWAEALGRRVDDGSDAGFASIGGADTERTEPAWYFEHVEESKTAKNRLHLDLLDPDPEAVARLVSLGATVVATHELQGHEWTVLQDPEGNEFCVAARAFGG